MIVGAQVWIDIRSVEVLALQVLRLQLDVSQRAGLIRYIGIA